MISAKILLDSYNVDAKTRLTTFELTFPRFILAEINTHRTLSRNAASSRAIPFSKMAEAVANNPVFPVEWGRNQPGMKAEEILSQEDTKAARDLWIHARDYAVEYAEKLYKLGVHKQIVNRLLEPWMWCTTITSATNWNNFFKLRAHKAAQPEFRTLAFAILEAYRKSVPDQKHFGDVHAPLVAPEEMLEWGDINLIMKVSTARCARVSYVRHLEKRDVNADITLHDRLLSSGHLSPFEHVATALSNRVTYGNFAGWRQYRKELSNESGENFDIGSI